ncbi:MAG: GerMN domain-containing protein [Deltaproteobacteria bacterium]|nr:GerMN domain-containing protein [Deltaproteobacteria bacterium]
MAGSKKKPKTPKTIWIVFWVALVTFIAGVVFMAWFGEKALPPTVPEKAKTKEITLYFSDIHGKGLVAVKKKIDKDNVTREVTEALNALSAGHIKDKDIVGALPPGTRLLSVSIKEGTAFVDFSGEITSNHPGGSSAELQTIYAIVNTVTLNFPAIKTVQILVEGQKLETLAGHIMINIPLGPDKAVIKG